MCKSGTVDVDSKVGVEFKVSRKGKVREDDVSVVDFDVLLFKSGFRYNCFFEATFFFFFIC